MFDACRGTLGLVSVVVLLAAGTVAQHGWASPRHGPNTVLEEPEQLFAAGQVRAYPFEIQVAGPYVIETELANGQIELVERHDDAWHSIAKSGRMSDPQLELYLDRGGYELRVENQGRRTVTYVMVWANGPQLLNLPIVVYSGTRRFAPGVEHFYYFSVSAEQEFVFETFGPGATTLRLRRGSSIVALDEDGLGLGENARVDLRLRPGDYTLEVEGRGQTGGAYEVRGFAKAGFAANNGWPHDSAALPACADVGGGYGREFGAYGHRLRSIVEVASADADSWCRVL
jgi:hypothetical protein